jgi:hypothetical protein
MEFPLRKVLAGVARLGVSRAKVYDRQVARAEQAVAGKTAINRNRFVRLAGGDRSVNRERGSAQRPDLMAEAALVTEPVPGPASLAGRALPRPTAPSGSCARRFQVAGF